MRFRRKCQAFDQNTGLSTESPAFGSHALLSYRTPSFRLAHPAFGSQAQLAARKPLSLKAQQPEPVQDNQDGAAFMTDHPHGQGKVSPKGC